MSKVKNTLIISSSLFASWIIFEYLLDKLSKKQIKKQILNIEKERSTKKFSNYYYKSFSIIRSELEAIKDEEKNHTLMSLKKSFLKRSSSNLESLVKQIDYYKRMRTESVEDFCRYVRTDNMLWYPYTFRFFFSLLNNFFISIWKWNYIFEVNYYRKHYIYKIKPKNNSYDKTIVIFIGLGGILQPFYKLINYLIEKNYQVIIPLYGPSQASLCYNFNCHEIEFQLDLYDYLVENNFNKIEILSWSLGGILYKGFENYILKLNTLKNCKIKVRKAYLFEPLLCMRGCMDTYFSNLRNYSDTLHILNSVTSKKYYNYNKIFSYFLHTQIGFSTSNSFGCFTSVELKNIPYISFPRYLFVSSDDIIINYNLDRDFINFNFEKEKTYHRRGYHGGWLNSSKLYTILNDIMK